MKSVKKGSSVLSFYGQYRGLLEQGLYEIIGQNTLVQAVQHSRKVTQNSAVIVRDLHLL